MSEFAIFLVDLVVRLTATHTAITADSNNLITATGDQLVYTDYA